MVRKCSFITKQFVLLVSRAGGGGGGVRLLIDGHDSACSWEEIVCLEWRCPIFIPVVFCRSHLAKAVVRSNTTHLEQQMLPSSSSRPFCSIKNEKGGENGAWKIISGRYYVCCD